MSERLTVIEDKSLHKFQKKLNELLRNGWKLHGSIHYEQHQPNGFTTETWYTQAVVKCH